MSKEFREYIIQEYENNHNKLIELDYDLVDNDKEFMFYQGKECMLLDIIYKFSKEFFNIEC